MLPGKGHLIHGKELGVLIMVTSCKCLHSDRPFFLQAGYT